MTLLFNGKYKSVPFINSCEEIALEGTKRALHLSATIQCSFPPLFLKNFTNRQLIFFLVLSLLLSY